MSDSVTNEKTVIRERLRALRQSLSPEEVLEAGAAVSRVICEYVRSTGLTSTCVYASTGKEVPTRDLMQNLMDAGVTVGVPDWEAWKQGYGLEIAGIGSLNDLLREGRVVPQPSGPNLKSVPVEDVELFLVPGIAFDRSGRRLGMGGGYFDRLLSRASSKAIFLGLAYDFQVVTHLPSEDHDVSVHDVVTPGTVRVQGVDNKQEGKSYGS